MGKKYNKNFTRDFNWYLSVRYFFNFDGVLNYYDKKGENMVVYSKDGVDGKEAFFQWDSNGVIKPTKHPNLLYSLLKTKGSVNLHIKMYAEDRRYCYLSKIEMMEICKQIRSPEWFLNAVEKQKWKN